MLDELNLNNKIMSSLIDIDVNYIEKKLQSALHENAKLPRGSSTKIYPKKNDKIQDHFVFLKRLKCNKFAYLNIGEQVFYNFHNYYIQSINRSDVLVNGEQYL